MNKLSCYCNSSMTRVTDWQGKELGRIVKSVNWKMPISCYISSRQYQITVNIAGRLYTGRTFGGNMLANLRLKSSGNH